eukprot:157600-Pelagomonas_calceolata.AAC.1
MVRVFIDLGGVKHGLLSMTLCVAPAIHGEIVCAEIWKKFARGPPPPFREVKFLKEGSWLVEGGVGGIGEEYGAEMEAFMMVQSAARAALLLLGLPLMCFTARIRSL